MKIKGFLNVSLGAKPVPAGIFHAFSVSCRNHSLILSSILLVNQPPSTLLFTPGDFFTPAPSPGLAHLTNGEFQSDPNINIQVALPPEIVFSAAPDFVPDWWDFIQSNFVGRRLKLCRMRNNVAPETNDKCAKRPKTCFFGNQTCEVVPSAPTMRCFCPGLAGNREWQCESFACPQSQNQTIS